MKLYTYFRSSAAYRVRIALNLKQLPYTSIPVHLVRDGGQQKQPDYKSKNPQGLVPMLESDNQVLTQSLAIIEYLEESHPHPALLPESAAERARVRALAQLVACDIHPLNNLRVLQHLEQSFGADAQAKADWYRHWINEGFAALETMLNESGHTGDFCHSDQPGLADICLVPQVYNALRFDCDMRPYPTISAINERCLALSAFSDAAPENQPDCDL